MAGLAETEEFPEEVYQIETNDPVVGGAPNEGTGAGMSNIPHLQLAKRTRWLKAKVDTLLSAVVDATTAVKGIVQLSMSTNSTSTTTAATPSAVKAVNDNANTRALQTTTISASGLASGGGTLAANRTIDVPVATQAEAEAGTINTAAMTPLRVAQAIANLIKSATTAVAGIVQLSTSTTSTSTTMAATPSAVKAVNDNANTRALKTTTVTGAGLATGGGDLSANRTITVPIATQAEAEAGTADDKAMTPLSTAQAIAELAAPALGAGQTLQDMTAVRAGNTAYQNTTGKPILVFVVSSGSSGGSAHRLEVSADNVTYHVMSFFSDIDSSYGSTVAVVPDGSFVKLTNGTVSKWMELR